VNEFDVICGRLLSTRDGQEFLVRLRHRHFETGGSPLADEPSLRVRAANQQFVLEIERARDRGLAVINGTKAAG
jgi:hypothetical protein